MSTESESEKYTVVLTGKYGDERSYLILDEAGNYERVSGFPPPGRIRGEIPFDDLPDAAKQEVLKVYRETWNL